jgi:hypothetical protein
MDNWGLILGKGRDFSSLALHPDCLWSSPASYAMGMGVLSLGVKQLGQETDHSPPSTSEVKNAWSYTSTSLYVCMV